MNAAQAENLISIIGIFNRVRANDAFVSVLRELSDKYTTLSEGFRGKAISSLEFRGGKIALSALQFIHKNYGGLPGMSGHEEFLNEINDDIHDLIGDSCQAIMKVTDDEWIIDRAALKVLLSNEIGFQLANGPDVWQDGAGIESETVYYYCEHFSL